MNNKTWHAALLSALAVAVAGCAASGAAHAPGPSFGTAMPKGAEVSGVLVAIRPMRAQPALSPGAATVLRALRLSPQAATPNATEFVIQRADGNIAAIVLGAPQSSPTASLSAASFALGDKVELLTGRQVQLIHASP